MAVKQTLRHRVPLTVLLMDTQGSPCLQPFQGGAKETGRWGTTSKGLWYDGSQKPASKRAPAFPSLAHEQGDVWKALASKYGRTFFVSGVVKLFHDALMLSTPLLLEALLVHLGSSPNPSRGEKVGVGGEYTHE